jgi:hypothetical protein
MRLTSKRLCQPETYDFYQFPYPMLFRTVLAKAIAKLPIMTSWHCSVVGESLSGEEPYSRRVKPQDVLGLKAEYLKASFDGYRPNMEVSKGISRTAKAGQQRLRDRLLTIAAK